MEAKVCGNAGLPQLTDQFAKRIDAIPSAALESTGIPDPRLFHRQ